MAIEGINTGSGYNVNLGGSGIGISGRDNISKTPRNAETTGNGAAEINSRERQTVEPLENQVAVSQDGDTVQISPKATAKYDEAIKEVRNKKESEENEPASTGERNKVEKVELKAEKVQNARKEARLKAEKRAEALKEAAENAKKKEAVSEQKESISFAGKSDSDVKLLYLEGQISKADYDSEISTRDKLRALLEKKNNNVVDVASEGHRISKKLERFGESIKAAFSDKAGKTFDAGTRLDAIEVAEGSKKAEKDKKKLENREVKISFN